MPQYPLDFRQLCPTFQHPPGQSVAKHMRGVIFQPPIWPVHEKYNVKEYATRIERAGDQPRQVGQRGRVAEDKP